MEHTTNPLDEQEIFCVKTRIPELDTAEDVRPYGRVHFFNGAILEASSKLSICNKVVAESVLMKPNCACAISQSNKRYLAGYNVPTDYVEPNPLLFAALGFSEQESKTLVYVYGLDDLPIDTVVYAYALKSNNEALPTPKIGFQLKNGMRIADDEAAKVLADWFADNGYESIYYEDFMEYESIEEAWADANVSAEAREYGEFIEEEPWEQLEAACLYEAAAALVEDLCMRANSVYCLLHKKYEAAGLILAKLQLSWGLDEDAEPILCNDVGTTDNALIVSRELYQKNGTLDDMVTKPVLEYFETVGYKLESDEPVPEIPEDVLDEVSDTYMYLAEAICDDLAFEIHM